MNFFPIFHFFSVLSVIFILIMAYKTYNEMTDFMRSYLERLNMLQGIIKDCTTTCTKRHEISESRINQLQKDFLKKEEIREEKNNNTVCRAK